MGAGQPNRKVAVRLAIDKAKENIAKEQQMDESKLLANTVLLSEAFFPFADSILELFKVGISAVIQPGGSIKDSEVIEAADKSNMSMVFTQIRHFKH